MLTPGRVGMHNVGD